MWQRIQTFYMAIVVIIIAVALFFISKVPFIILFAAALLCNLVPIFTFRHRMLQMRLLIFSVVVLLGLQVWMIFDYLMAGAALKLSYAYVVPFIGAILDFLAIRGVISDELIVRSSSRLRAAKRKQTK